MSFRIEPSPEREDFFKELEQKVEGLCAAAKGQRDQINVMYISDYFDYFYTAQEQKTRRPFLKEWHPDDQCLQGAIYKIIFKNEIRSLEDTVIQGDILKLQALAKKYINDSQTYLLAKLFEVLQQRKNGQAKVDSIIHKILIYQLCGNKAMLELLIKSASKEELSTGGSTMLILRRAAFEGYVDFYEQIFTSMQEEPFTWQQLAIMLRDAIHAKNAYCCIVILSAAKEKAPLLILEQGWMGRTPMHEACENMDLATLKTLLAFVGSSLETVIQIQDDDGNRPSDHIFRHICSITSYPFQPKIDPAKLAEMINFMQKEAFAFLQLAEVFHKAVIHRDANCCQVILSAAQDKAHLLLEAKDRWDHTPLHYAFQYFDAATLKMLLALAGSSTGRLLHISDRSGKRPIDRMFQHITLKHENKIDSTRLLEVIEVLGVHWFEAFAGASKIDFLRFAKHLLDNFTSFAEMHQGLHLAKNRIEALQYKFYTNPFFQYLGYIIPNSVMQMGLHPFENANNAYAIWIEAHIQLDGEPPRYWESIPEYQRHDFVRAALYLPLLRAHIIETHPDAIQSYIEKNAETIR